MESNQSLLRTVDLGLCLGKARTSPISSRIKSLESEYYLLALGVYGYKSRPPKGAREEAVVRLHGHLKKHNSRLTRKWRDSDPDLLDRNGDVVCIGDLIYRGGFFFAYGISSYGNIMTVNLTDYGDSYHGFLRVDALHRMQRITYTNLPKLQRKAFDSVLLDGDFKALYEKQKLFNNQ